MSATQDKIEDAPQVAEHNNLARVSSLKAEGPMTLKSTYDTLGYWETVRVFWKPVLACNLISIAAAADGYQYTLNGNVIANEGFINHVGFLKDGKYALHSDYTALWGAMQSVGQLVGMVFMSPISDRVGRKCTLYLLWIVLAGSLVLETLTRDWKDWTAAKVLAGIGVGALQATLPIYIAEWAPSNIRGGLVLTYGVWNTLGKFLAPLVLLICERINPLNYKTPILTQWVFLGLMAPIFLWLPETPQYYAERDQDDRGRKTLRRLNGNVPGYDVDTEYNIIKNSILEQRRRQEDDAGAQSTQSWNKLLKSYVECFQGVNAKRTLGAALPACAQQLTGLSFLKTYASLFFREAGFDDPFLITTILTIIALLTSIALMLFTDKFGRRMVIFISTISSTLMLLVIGIIGQFTLTKTLQHFAIFVASVWALFNGALGSLGWAFVGEISTQKLRARTAGLAAGMSVIFGLVFNTSVPIMCKSIVSLSSLFRNAI